MNELITTTLQFSKGLGEQVMQRVDVRGLLREICMDFCQRGDRVDLEGQGPCLCEISVGAFRRVVQNLLENAVRYSGDEPVTVRVGGCAERLLVEVIDRGPGIPADQREQVFQPFKRLEGSRNRSSGGSGLGLAIVEQLCIANEWDIRLKESAFGGVTAELSLTCPD
jgi:two-component system osmolarity sensor histidine kinase EnvZ